MNRLWMRLSTTVYRRVTVLLKALDEPAAVCEPAPEIEIGALIDTRAVIEGLKSGQIGTLGLDVYEEESGLFFEDLSQRLIQDDVFTRLLTFPNVVITGHQAFFTQEALQGIAATTLENVTAFATGRGTLHALTG